MQQDPTQETLEFTTGGGFQSLRHTHVDPPTDTHLKLNSHKCGLMDNLGKRLVCKWTGDNLPC